MRSGVKTKQTISKVALKLFVVQGYKESTIKDIANKAKVSEGAMYRHYATKDELANELFVTNYIAYADELERLCDSEKSLKNKINIMINYFCKEFDRDKILFSYLLLTRYTGINKLPKNTKSPVDVVKEQIEFAMKNKEIKKMDPELSTALIMGIVLEPAKYILFGRMKTKLSTHSEEITTACLKILDI